jgi:predicted Zn-dependent protease
VQEVLSKSAVVQEVAQLLGAAGSIAAVTGYSRELETEADRIGLDLMAKANYDPKEALKLFEHLKQEIESEGIAEPFFFGTHPNVQQRMENVQNWLAGDKQGYKTRVRNSAEFKNRMQGAILTNVRLDLRLGRFEVAQKTLEKYLAMQPNDAQAYYLFGESYRQRDLQNDARTAVSYYAKAISLDPLFPEPHKALGLIHYKEGDKHQAKKYFESCLLLSPNASDKAYIRQYLKNCQHNGEKS